MDDRILINFLGTGTSQGVPVIACRCAICTSTDARDKRLRTSVMVQTQGKTIVIDSGPDFRQQMLRAEVKQLDALIYTHEHKDHIAGMDDIRAFNYVHKKKVDIYASLAVQDALKREFHYVFSEEKYPGVPEINLFTIDIKPFVAAGVEIIPIEARHFQIPVFGFRIGDFSYLTDANYISDKEKEKMRGSKVLVVNGLRREPHVSHFSFEEAVDLIKSLEPEKGFLTHISHQLGKHEDIDAELPANISPAYDGLEIEI